MSYLKKTNEIVEKSRVENLYARIIRHIETARNNIVRTVDIEQVRAYWFIGRDIVEEEQSGKARADYGAFLLQEISDKLIKKYGNGFGVRTLIDIRKFYIVYSPIEKTHALRAKSQIPEFKSNLGWTHYRSLMRVAKPEARAFYEIEASKNNWSSRELDRQIGSLLFDRLALSKDKKGLLKLAEKGQEIIKPEDVLKEPVILEFLGIPESTRLVESKLEEALITHLQSFLLELGRGFAFIGRQKRLTLDGQHFYVDLVFYHTVLKSYILIDLKTKPLTHADLGQMQLYRNYYDMECLSKGDGPTIGLILCTKKSDKMVKYFLKNDDKIFARKYQLNLPTEEELVAELQREIKEIKCQLQKSEESCKTY